MQNAINLITLSTEAEQIYTETINRLLSNGLTEELDYALVATFAQAVVEYNRATAKLERGDMQYRDELLAKNMQLSALKQINYATNHLGMQPTARKQAKRPRGTDNPKATTLAEKRREATESD